MQSSRSLAGKPAEFACLLQAWLLSASSTLAQLAQRQDKEATSYAPPRGHFLFRPALRGHVPGCTQQTDGQALLGLLEDSTAWCQASVLGPMHVLSLRPVSILR